MNRREFNKEMFNYAQIESARYRKLAGTLLRAESITKSRRYGVDAYRKLFIQHPDKAFSSYMNTFLYLREMEESYNEIKHIYKNQL